MSAARAWCDCAGASTMDTKAKLILISDAITEFQQRHLRKIHETEHRIAALRREFERTKALTNASYYASLYRHGDVREALNKVTSAVSSNAVTAHEMARETQIPVAEIEAALAERKAITRKASRWSKQR
jgi:uncharacterized small protein (DUF1192 family)